MVDYAEEADFLGHKKPKKYISPQEAQRRREDRNAARTADDWKRYARDAVYRQLGMRDRSTYELRQALKKRSVPEEIAEETINSFAASGLVNDTEFAMKFVRARCEERCSSQRALAEDLRKRGISVEDIELALAQIDPEDERAAAIELASRKIRSMRLVDREVARRRLYGMLARRGFSSSDIRHALELALDTLDSESIV